VQDPELFGLGLVGIRTKVGDVTLLETHDEHPVELLPLALVTSKYVHAWCNGGAGCR